MENKNNNHFFFDGYDIKKSRLDKYQLISNLLNEINKIFLNNSGKNIIIPCFNNEKKEDDGISGIVLGNGFHFTCHTFNNRETIFVDLFNANSSLNNDLIISLLQKYFKVINYDLCKNNELTGKFGKHIIISTSLIKFEKALNFIDDIITNINMHPIHEKIYVQNDSGYDILRPIAESHISIHSIGNNSCIDVFSCKGFDEEKIFEKLDCVNSVYKVERGIYLPETTMDKKLSLRR